MPSLQDQLLKAGLIDAKQAKQANKDKRKQAQVERRSKEGVVDEVKQAVEQATQEKLARDKALNEARDQALQQKALLAQAKQLIESHQQPFKQGGTEVEYHFTDGAKIKKIRVCPRVEKWILAGTLCVVKQDTQYRLVPAVVARKIAERASELIIPVVQTPQSTPEEDDPYKDYVIPDDLMW
jgi:uncharacterized protein